MQAITMDDTEVQPQEVWLNASKPIVRITVTATRVFSPHPSLISVELPSIGSLPVFAEILGQRNSTWIAELIEAREYAHHCHVLVRWMYRPRERLSYVCLLSSILLVV